MDRSGGTHAASDEDEDVLVGDWSGRQAVFQRRGVGERAVFATQHSSGEVVDQRDRVASLIGLAECSTSGVVGGGLDAVVLIARVLPAT